MTCTYTSEEVAKTISFHGHSCPGLAIGIRAAEYVQREFPDIAQADLVCVTETDMCGVDAIQYLTGCTYGKGNLIHRDYGKNAFSFFDRNNDRGIRLVLKQDARGTDHDKMTELMSRNSTGELSVEEKHQLTNLRAEVQKRLMTLPLEEIFAVQNLEVPAPRAARVLESLYCVECQEYTMESRTRRFGGRVLCIPCYEKVEQKM
jgi:formylmethanofuran dehydrogenase subunit E